MEIFIVEEIIFILISVIEILKLDFKTFLSLMKPKRYRFIIIFLAPN